MQTFPKDRLEQMSDEQEKRSLAKHDEDRNSLIDAKVEPVSKNSMLISIKDDSIKSFRDDKILQKKQSLESCNVVRRINN